MESNFTLESKVNFPSVSVYDGFRSNAVPQQTVKNMIDEIKKVHLKRADVYVYCANADIALISEVMSACDINVYFNIDSHDSFEGKTLLHYKSAQLGDDINNLLILATKYGAYVEPLISYLDKRLGRTEVALLHSGYFLNRRAFSILSSASNRMVKRMLDLTGSLILSLIALPVCLMAALAIRIESPGPIFFKQRRTGQFNKEFDVIKLRSMRTDAEMNGAQWASKNDPRVTTVGRFIRKTRIDELPQLLNVFRGEMSLVGPRPEREVFITELEQTIPYYRFRHAVKPGITGLAQVRYPYGASVEDAVWKHKYDIFYIKHQCLVLEIKILLLTIKTVIFGSGR